MQRDLTPDAIAPAPGPQGPLGLAEVIVRADAAKAQGRLDLAIAQYQEALPWFIEEPLSILLFNLAACHAEAGQLKDAEERYTQAVTMRPRFKQAWYNLGSIRERQNNAENAVRVWQSIIDSQLCSAADDPGFYCMTLNSIGRVLETLRRYPEAEAALRQSLACDPQQPKVVSHYVHLRQKQCKWPMYEDLPGLSIGQQICGTSALAMLSVTDDPGLQLAASYRYVKDTIQLHQVPLAPAQGYKDHDRIRLGFASGDLCMHAVSLLTVELFEILNKEQFALYAFCWSREDGTLIRQRVKSAFEYFIPVGHLNDQDAARLIRNHEIDVLIDLQGLTAGARPNIIAAKPAPVIINYLGFPGTCGIPQTDYILADRFVIPDAERPYYSETPLYLPTVFQCSDSQRLIGPPTSRKEWGLPEDAFVFCCMNNNYKFHPELVAAWADILHQCPGSVLWLLSDNTWAEANLRQAFAAHGVEPSRLVFSGRADPRVYLSRYRCADLFLDAWPFNGGTTTNDALFAGLPVLTKPGRAFASRMAGSLLHSRGCDNLIARDAQDYVKKAVVFFRSRQIGAHHIWAGIQEGVAAGNGPSASQRFTREFEEAVASVVRRG